MTSIFDSIFEKAKGVADTAAKKTGELVELSKYKIESVRINNEIEKLHQKLGSVVYLMVKGGYENRDLIEGLSEEIDENMMRLEAINEKIGEMSELHYCHVCGTKNANDNCFCVKCGTKIRDSFETETEFDNTREEQGETETAVHMIDAQDESI